MNKISDLASVLVTKYGLTQKEAELFVTNMFAVIGSGLQSNDKQVKVKGLGTFKIQSVNARESVNVNTGERIIIEGRNKISFTPETSLKNRVNQPFSQFETVVINDGVDFSELENNDIADEMNNNDEKKVEEEQLEEENKDLEEENRDDERIIEDLSVNINDENRDVVILDENKDNISKSNVQDAACNPDEIKFLREESCSPKCHISDEASVPENIQTDTSDIISNKKKNNIIIALIIFIVLLSGFGAYSIFYYQKQIALREDRILELEIIIDNFQTKVNKNKALYAVNNQQKINEDSAKVAKSDSTISKKTISDNGNKFNSEIYNKDPRIRTGAYTIVGIAQVITLKDDQSLSSISKKYLGPGMECYIEAVNENKKFEKGEQINIPKLKIKKIRN